jgi:ubiquinone/menaquinone biosynthesis C-methylase UbiE
VADRYSTAALAEGYAKARPPLHERIVRRIGVPARSVLDVGCGAGLSTRPLIADRVVGIDPFGGMVRWGPRTARSATFAVARAEALPFCDGNFDLITAAGSLNYADPARAFPELRRVLTPDGTLVVYDFSQDNFAYHRPPDGAIPLDPEILRDLADGFRVARSERFTFTIEMDRDGYEAYLRTEIDHPPPVERGATLDFSGYIAWLTPTAPL